MSKTLQPAKQRKRSLVFRFCLWMLFLLFIPTALYATDFGQVPELVYTESKSVFWRDGFHEILFSKLPDGTVPARNTKIHDAYQSLGVSISFGTPDRLEEMKSSEGALAQTQIKTKSGELVSPNDESGQQVDEHQTHVGETRGLDVEGRPKKGASNTNAPSNSSKLKNTKKQVNKKGFVGISGYTFRFPPDAQFTHSICCFEEIGKFTRRFRGPMTIRFHQPDSPDADAGVHFVGFFAAQLNTSETLRVKLFTPSGRLIGSQSNLSDKCVFMGFESKHKIGWLEIEAIGSDKDYAIGNLIFDEVK